MTVSLCPLSRPLRFKEHPENATQSLDPLELHRYPMFDLFRPVQPGFRGDEVQSAKLIRGAVQVPSVERGSILRDGEGAKRWDSRGWHVKGVF